MFLNPFPVSNPRRICLDAFQPSCTLSEPNRISLSNPEVQTTPSSHYHHSCNYCLSSSYNCLYNEWEYSKGLVLVLVPKRRSLHSNTHHKLNPSGTSSWSLYRGVYRAWWNIDISHPTTGYQQKSHLIGNHRVLGTIEADRANSFLSPIGKPETQQLFGWLTKPLPEAYPSDYGCGYYQSTNVHDEESKSRHLEANPCWVF